jgi:outer membrane protein
MRLKRPLTHDIMKTVKLICCLLAFCSIGLSSYGQAKIAIVDLRKVFDDYYKTKAADNTLKDRAGDLEKERKALTDQYQKLTEDYKKALDGANDQAVSTDEREKRKKTAESKLLEIKELEQNLTQFDRQSRTTLEEQQRRMRENILAEIKNVVTTKARMGSYSLVIDTAAESINKTPVVMFSNGENDITASVLTQLNATAPPTAKEEKK